MSRYIKLLLIAIVLSLTCLVMIKSVESQPGIEQATECIQDDQAEEMSMVELTCTNQRPA